VYEEVRYEGYGPGGVAIMVDCITDNKNRTTPEIRAIFGKNGGNLGESGSVNYLFDRKGLIIIEGGKVTEDEIMEMLLDFDVEDVKTEDGNIVITTSPDGYNEISDFLVKKEYTLIENQLTYIAKTSVPLDEKKAGQCMRIIELLEEQDDAQEVYSNYDISDEIMLKISEQ
jgi:YebC/PmpR family DNA-binding regulatory protein